MNSSDNNTPPTPASNAGTPVPVAAGHSEVVSQPFRTRLKLKDIDTSGADDLTAIQGISRQLAARLRELGIRRYRQISQWDHARVIEVSKALDIGRQISRQNWIEQAELLAQADRAAGNTVEANATPRVVPGSRGEPAKPEVAGLTLADDPVPQQPATLQSIMEQAGAAVAVIAIEAADSGVANADDRPEVVAGIAVIDAVDSSINIDAVDGPETSVHSPDVAVAADHPAPEAPGVPLEVEAGPAADTRETPETADRFDYIAGVTPEAALSLVAGGVTTWGQIASWSASDIAWWQSVLGPRVTIAKDGWLAQAAILAAGNMTRYATDVRAGKVPEGGKRCANAKPARKRSRLLDRLTLVEAATPAQQAANDAQPSKPLLAIISKVSLRTNPQAGLAELIKRADSYGAFSLTPAHPLATTATITETPEAVPMDKYSDAPERDGSLATAEPGSLRRRMEKLRQRPTFDATSYAAYRGMPEEAAVEIVSRSPRDGDPLASPRDSQSGIADPAQAPGRLERLIKSLARGSSH